MVVRAAFPVRTTITTKLRKVSTMHVRQRRMPVLAAVAAVVWAAGAAFGSALPAMAEDAPAPAEPTADVTWGVRTGSPDGQARENFTYEVGPGGTLEDSIVIANYDEEPLHLALYAADGFTTTSGQLDVLTKDAESVDLGAWVTLGQSDITIDPGASAEVPFSVDVPRNATPGDHAGAIVTSLAVPESEDGITVDRRLGIRIYLRVAGDVAPSLAIDNLHVDYAGSVNPLDLGTATATYTVRNDGNARLAAGQSVTLTGPFGWWPGAAIAVEKVPQLLPGETWQVAAPLGAVIPLIQLTADVTATPVLPDGAQVKPVTESSTFWAVPWALLILILFVVAVVVATIVLGRRRRRRNKAAEEARIQSAVDQALAARDAKSEAVAP